MPENLDPAPEPIPGTPDATFADLLRRHRRGAGFTQEELAERAGLSARTISDLERGVKLTPRRDTLQLLGAALELSDEAWEHLQQSVGSRAKPSRKPTETRSNLLIWLTPFVGRRAEVDGLRDRLMSDEVRLLTLTGAAGAGKTRLAVEVAEGLKERFVDGVCFVALAPVIDASGVRPAITRAVAELLGMPHAVLGDLSAYLRSKQMLLVLDNFEHVTAAAPDIAQLLAGCPSVTALVTSRGALRVSGEHCHEVAPLSLPEDGAVLSTEHVVQVSEAVELFVRRARAANDQFEPDTSNLATLVAICRRLDGPPLAIELAAARMGLLGLAEILEGLDRPLDLLTGGSRDAPARHHALRDTLEWSYQQLSTRERAAFVRLGACAGGCDLAATEALILDAQGLEAEDVVECLSSLVDSSLLRSWEDSSGRSRFGMLETMKAFAIERLDRNGEIERVSRLHAEYYVQLAEQAAAELLGPDQSRWYKLLEIEHANFLAALTWARDSGFAGLGRRFGGALWRTWEASNRLEEGLSWLETFLEMDAGSSDQVRAEALNGAGMLASALGRYDQAEQFLDECLRLRLAGDDREGISRVYNNHGVVAMRRGNYADAEQFFEHSLGQMDEHVDGHWVALSSGNLGMTKLYQGDLVAARLILEDNLERSRRLGMAQEVADTLNGLGLVALYDGELVDARLLLTESKQVAEESRNVACEIEVTRGVGCVLLARGWAEDAIPFLRTALKQAFESGDVRRTVKGLDALGCVACELGQRSRASRLWAIAEKVRTKRGIVEHRVERGFHDEWRTRLRAREETDARASIRAGRLGTLDEAVAYALSDVADG